MHARLRKIIKTRGHFPSDDAALRNIAADWHRAAREWREAMNQFAIAYGERFTRSAVWNDERLSHRAACLRRDTGRRRRRGKVSTASHTEIRTPPQVVHGCSAEMHIIAFITDSPSVREILARLGEPTSPPRIAPARGPPWREVPVAAPAEYDPQAQPAPDYEFDQRIA